VSFLQAFGAFAGAGGIAPYEFLGGDQTVGSIYELAELMGNSITTQTPTSGGTLTVNSVSLSSYDYTIKQGNQTISSFSTSDWFTSTEDTRSAFIAVNGNLIINSGQTVIPSVRKLFTCIYVSGDLTVNGSISMTARGANHSGTGNSGGATTKAAMRIITGTYGGVSNPQVPADGGAGGANNYNAAGTAGTAGGTGGGGQGANDIITGGAGSAGTSFTGGGGGGGARVYPVGGTQVGGIAVSNGGKGGAAGPNSWNSSGGSGNPGGDTCIPVNSFSGGLYCYAGNPGTGGVLLIIVNGNLAGSGSIVANGVGSPAVEQRSGGGSGGGSITILAGSDSSSITPTASGGVGGGAGASGGSGGAGTARKLALA
jgi:hypothetical protein